MGISDSKHVPNLGKLSIAVVEYYVAKVIGEDAKDEVKKPHERKKLRKQIERIFADTEKRFIVECDDEEVGRGVLGVLDLPLEGLPTLMEAVYEFYDRPTNPSLDRLLQQQLVEDFPSISSKRIQVSVEIFMNILREELASSGPQEVQERLNTLANLQTANSLKKLVQTQRAEKTPVGFEKTKQEYLKYLVQQLKDHTLRGFAPQVGGRALSLPLSEIFLPLQAVEGRPALAEYAEQDLRRQAVHDDVQQEGLRELSR